MSDQDEAEALAAYHESMRIGRQPIMDKVEARFRLSHPEKWPDEPSPGVAAAMDRLREVSK